MTRRHVYIAMATRDRPEIETQIAMLHAMRAFEAAGVKMTLKYCVRDSMIPKTRNQFVMDAIRLGADDLVMLDDDVVWEEGAILRLLSHDADVVGGVYPKRTDPLQYPIRRLPGAKLDQETGLLEVKYLPGGFLRMRVSALKRMVEHFAHLRYRDDDVPGGEAVALFWFDLHPDDEMGEGLTVWGEDFTFCRRWREMGGSVMCDTLLRFQHIGRKAYDGCYAETMPVAALFASHEVAA